jgi:hypothetical protein
MSGKVHQGTVVSAECPGLTLFVNIPLSIRRSNLWSPRSAHIRHPCSVAFAPHELGSRGAFVPRKAAICPERLICRIRPVCRDCHRQQLGEHLSLTISCCFAQSQNQNRAIFLLALIDTHRPDNPMPATEAHATSRAQPLPPNNSTQHLHVQVCSCYRFPSARLRLPDAAHNVASPRSTAASADSVLTLGDSVASSWRSTCHHFANDIDPIAA